MGLKIGRGSGVKEEFRGRDVAEDYKSSGKVNRTAAAKL